MVFEVLRLGTECTDKATELVGTVTHWTIDMGEHIDYLFQPRGLDEDHQPLRKFYICSARLDVKPEDFEEVDIPLEILGSQVEDKASGFAGMAVEFIRHINGCFHVVIQPAGTLKGKNTAIERNDFDLRACRGEKIPEMTATELKASEEDEPSPTGDTFNRQLSQGLESNIPKRH